MSRWRPTAATSLRRSARRGLAIGTRVARDIRGIARVAGAPTAARWTAAIALEARRCLAAGNLQVADGAMGEGPFEVQYGRARARLVGQGAFSGMREIWVRDVYLHRGFLTIQDGDLVVDLGANMGNFTALALAHGPRVRVVAVEANSHALPALRRTIEVNRSSDRVEVVNAFVGGNTAVQDDLRSRPGGNTVQTISEQEIIELLGRGRIALLKCDIEGSELALLTPDSKLLSMSRQLAIELHRFAGSEQVDTFGSMLCAQGFEVVETQRDSDGVTLAARRR